MKLMQFWIKNKSKNESENENKIIKSKIAGNADLKTTEKINFAVKACDGQSLVFKDNNVAVVIKNEPIKPKFGDIVQIAYTIGSSQYANFITLKVSKDKFS
jgi:hypothetical protein